MFNSLSYKPKLTYKKYFIVKGEAMMEKTWKTMSFTVFNVLHQGPQSKAL